MKYLGIAIIGVLVFAPTANADYSFGLGKKKSFNDEDLFVVEQPIDILEGDDDGDSLINFRQTILVSEKLVVELTAYEYPDSRYSEYKRYLKDFFRLTSNIPINVSIYNENKELCSSETGVMGYTYTIADCFSYLILEPIDSEALVYLDANVIY